MGSVCSSRFYPETVALPYCTRIWVSIQGIPHGLSTGAVSCFQVILTMEELLVKLKTWKPEREKCPHMNIWKTKILVSCVNLDLLKKSGNDH